MSGSKQILRNIFIYIIIFKSSFFAANPIDDISFKNANNLHNFYVEISAGTKEKWEINKKTGLLEKDQKNGKDRIINFLAYPGNYGFVPQTLSGDGDPIDLIDLEEFFPRGKFKKIKVIGAILFEDKKDVDYKFIGVSPTGTFKDIQSINDLLYERPSVVEILKKWFSSYKKPGEMIYFRYIDKEEALSLLDEAHKKWIRKQNKEK
ncbi:MAG: inorganic diphosphatase [bacterium]